MLEDFFLVKFSSGMSQIADLACRCSLKKVYCIMMFFLLVELKKNQNEQI